MLRTILYYGLVAGIVVAIPTSGLPIVTNGRHLPLAYGMLIGYASMLVALSAVFIAIKHYRDRELGGVIRFWPALAIGLGVSIVAGVIYVFAWELAMAVTHMDFANSYANTVIAEKKAAGASAEAIAKLTAEMDAFKVQYANPLYRWPMTFTEIFPVGVLVSLVSAALLRNSRFLALRRA